MDKPTFERGAGIPDSIHPRRHSDAEFHYRIKIKTRKKARRDEAVHRVRQRAAQHIQQSKRLSQA